MKKILIYSLMLTGMLMFMASCQYKFTIEPVVIPPDPTDTIYFSQSVEPIWNNGDFCTSCHKTGGTNPDLSTGNAYEALTSGGYIDTDNPSESMIYTYPLPGATTHSWKQYSETQAAILLQWIEQGALNN